MGVIKQGILGGFSGRVGSVIGGSWKGIAYMRSNPLSVANPKTAGQVAQRTKFSAVVALARVLLVGIIKPNWDRFAQLQSGYNAFVSRNIEFFNSSGDLTYASLVTSEGSLTPEDIGAIGANDGDTVVEVPWNSSAGSGSALGTDEAYVAVYNETKDEWGVLSGLVDRASELGDPIMPTAVAAGDVLHCYLSFRRADGTLVSNNTYKTANVA